MTPLKRTWALLLALGLWAGGASAQSDDDSGWFDEPSSGERPELKIHGRGQYDPPPPDFRSDPPGASDPSANPDDEELAVDEAEPDDADSQLRGQREFSPQLAPYGYWADDPFYGRVWVPHRNLVGSDFRPYVTGGRWELGPADEWVWASDYPFGGVTFHYGRWAWLSAGLGWGWVPGYVYAPAWVDFRVGSSGYVGWGPLPPYSVWRGGAFVSLGVRRPVPYIFCPTTYVFSTSLPRYVVHDHYRVRSIAAQTHRYRPRYVAGARVYGPTPRDARIPYRYVPSRRVIAQPRGSYVASEYRSGRVESGARRVDDVRRAPVRGSVAPSESRYRSVAPSESRYRGVAPSRERDGSSRQRSDPGPAPNTRSRRGPSAASPPPRATYSQPLTTPSPMRGERRNDATRGERRVDQPQRSREDGGRSRGSARPAERRDAPAARGGGRSGGSHAAPTQQRSRSRDRDGR